MKHVKTILIIFLFSACESLQNLNLIFTGEAGTPTDKTVQVTGLITDFKSPVLEHGHCYSKSPLPTVNDAKTELGSLAEVGTFVSLLTELEPKTLYFIRAYMITAEEVKYGEQINIETLQELPTIKDFQAITEGDISNINATSATAKGTLVTEVSINIIQYGHVWATQNTPTLTNNTGKSESGGTSISNNLAYTSNMTGLNNATKYYYRAYAVDNNNFVYYGEIKFFTTATN